MVRVAVAGQVTDELMRAMETLVPQLSSSAGPPSREELGEIVAADGATLLLARDGVGAVEGAAGHEPEAGAEEPCGPIVGMLTLITFRIPTGVRARIEDVVVDSRMRGHGVASELTRVALELAAARGAHTVDLTSRPSREAANRLYQHLGFEQRQTSVYRFQLPS